MSHLTFVVNGVALSFLVGVAGMTLAMIADALDKRRHA